MEDQLNKLYSRLTKIESDLEYMKKTNDKIFTILDNLSNIEKTNIQQNSEIKHLESEVKSCKSKSYKYDELKTEITLLQDQMSKINKWVFSIGTATTILIIKLVITKLGL